MSVVSLRMFLVRDYLSGFDKFILYFTLAHQKTCLKMKAYDSSALALEMQQLHGIDSGKTVQLQSKADQRVRQQPKR